MATRPAANKSRATQTSPRDTSKDVQTKQTTGSAKAEDLGLQMYELEINGLSHTFQFDAEDARKYVEKGAKKVRGGRVPTTEPVTVSRENAAIRSGTAPTGDDTDDGGGDDL